MSFHYHSDRFSPLVVPVAHPEGISCPPLIPRPAARTHLKPSWPSEYETSLTSLSLAITLARLMGQEAVGSLLKPISASWY
ncbi:Hypothetical protein NTJ_03344 [Nesidiocoris tenuis]|uniref:Anaphase-promoting complex subunit 1 n=1 Tax=Nesidiocoris tenuis TaxID=355587 RepID=A0ABN7AE27_9HEMI|nr:Hypothetical protein NTJ_03344 [Nesidiocoris tenuis]